METCFSPNRLHTLWRKVHFLVLRSIKRVGSSGSSIQMGIAGNPPPLPKSQYSIDLSWRSLCTVGTRDIESAQCSGSASCASLCDTSLEYLFHSWIKAQYSWKVCSMAFLSKERDLDKQSVKEFSILSLFILLVYKPCGLIRQTKSPC